MSVSSGGPLSDDNASRETQPLMARSDNARRCQRCRVGCLSVGRYPREKLNHSRMCQPEGLGSSATNLAPMGAVLPTLPRAPPEKRTTPTDVLGRSASPVHRDETVKQSPPVSTLRSAIAPGIFSPRGEP